jgi:hypothetical protein
VWFEEERPKESEDWELLAPLMDVEGRFKFGVGISQKMGIESNNFIQSRGNRLTAEEGACAMAAGILSGRKQHWLVGGSFSLIRDVCFVSEPRENRGEEGSAGLGIGGPRHHVRNSARPTGQNCQLPAQLSKTLTPLKRQFAVLTGKFEQPQADATKA